MVPRLRDSRILAPLAAGARFTQPGDHSLADSCTGYLHLLPATRGYSVSLQRLQHLYFLASDLALADRRGKDGPRPRPTEVHFRQASSSSSSPLRPSSEKILQRGDLIGAAGQVYFAEANGLNSHACLHVKCSLNVAQCGINLPPPSLPCNCLLFREREKHFRLWRCGWPSIVN